MRVKSQKLPDMRHHNITIAFIANICSQFLCFQYSLVWDVKYIMNQKRTHKSFITVRKGESISRYFEMTYKQKRWRSIPCPVMASWVNFVWLICSHNVLFKRLHFGYYHHCFVLTSVAISFCDTFIELHNLFGL